MKTIEPLFAAIQRCDINAITACLADDFVFQQAGLAPLDAVAFCEAIAQLGAAADNVALDTGAVNAQGAAVAITVALDAALVEDAPPALAELAQAGGLLVTVPQAWTILFDGELVDSITAAAVDGVGFAEVLVLAALPPVTA